MNILSIGNSFSQDAQRYLHQIAAAAGVEVNCFNLYIGGCSLARHYRNMLSGDREYMLEMNGQSTGFKVSLQEALLNREWDVVTLQQASPSSFNYDTWQPYLTELTSYVHYCVPKVKLAIHQTWAYEDGSARLLEVAGYESRAAMFADVRNAYAQGADAMDADFVIPSGEVFEELVKDGVWNIHRDTFHASRGVGRYALGLTWVRALTGKSAEGNTFADFDQPVSPEEMAKAQKWADEVCIRYGL